MYFPGENLQIMASKHNVKAVVIVSKPGGAVIARSRDLGLIFIQKSIVAAKFEANDPLKIGQWILLNAAETGEQSRPELGIYWWRATQVLTRIPNVFPNIDRGDHGEKLTIHQVPVVVTTSYTNYGFLYSEQLGRIKMDLTTTDGFDPKKFRAKSFAMVSVQPILEESQDYFWMTTKIEPHPAGSFSDFPSVRSCRGSMLSVYVGHGKLLTTDVGVVFFSFNDYFEDAPNRRPLSSFLKDYKNFEVLAVPTLHGYDSKYRAVYVKPIPLSTRSNDTPKKSVPAVEKAARTVEPTAGPKRTAPSVKNLAEVRKNSPDLDSLRKDAGSATPSGSSGIDEGAQLEKEVEELLFGGDSNGKDTTGTDVGTQADPTLEKELIKELLSDTDIFQTVSTKRPDLMSQLVKLVMERF